VRSGHVGTSKTGHPAASIEPIFRVLGVFELDLTTVGVGCRLRKRRSSRLWPSEIGGLDVRSHDCLAALWSAVARRADLRRSRLRNASWSTEDWDRAGWGAVGRIAPFSTGPRLTGVRPSADA
jgi:hypothetical protein